LEDGEGWNGTDFASLPPTPGQTLSQLKRQWIASPKIKAIMNNPSCRRRAKHVHAIARSR
jgi:hypothetical protein